MHYQIQIGKNLWLEHYWDLSGNATFHITENESKALSMNGEERVNAANALLDNDIPIKVIQVDIIKKEL